MAKSKSAVKTVAKMEEKTADAPIMTKVASGTPYQLDPAQVERAANTLVAHMKKHIEKKDEEAAVKNLADDEDEAQVGDQPIFLGVATKKHMNNTTSLKPTKMSVPSILLYNSHANKHRPLPHAIIANDVRVCIFTKDPQRAYKDLVASDAFPAALRTKVVRVLGVDKLKKRYKSFEQKRALLAEFDVFMVDERVLKIVAEFLGKTFYQSKSKRPIPIRLTAGTYIDKAARNDSKEPQNIVGTPQGVAKEIETALHSTYLSMSPSANTSIKIGTMSMTPQQIVANTTAVVTAITAKHIEQGWRNVRTLHIKGPATQAIPIWWAVELWQDETKVLDAPFQGKSIGAGKTAEKKRKWEAWEEEMLDDDELAEIKAKRASKKSKTVKKSGISKEKRRAMKEEVLKGVETPLIAG
jgi:ribosome biogenesis protein UTP30